MADLKSQLTEWSINYFKNKDIIARKIVSIDTNKDNLDVLITLKDTIHAVVVEPFLTNVQEILDRLRPFKGKKLSLITYNTKGNLNAVTANWGILSEFDHLFNIFFVNPLSATETKWVVFPHTHNSISGGKFQIGLKSMFDNVTPVTKEELDKH